MTAHRWNGLGDEILRYLATASQDNGSIHWPTVIAYSAALAGESALLVFAKNMPESGPVNEKSASDFIHNADSSALSIWDYALKIGEAALGVNTGALPEYPVMAQRISGALLPGAYPALSAPAHLAPLETPLNAGPRYRKAIASLVNPHGVDQRDVAFALMTASMKAVGNCRDVSQLDAMVLALESLVAGSRFVPLLEVAPAPARTQMTDYLTGSAPAMAPQTEASVQAPEPLRAVGGVGLGL